MHVHWLSCATNQQPPTSCYNSTIDTHVWIKLRISCSQKSSSSIVQRDCKPTQQRWVVNRFYVGIILQYGNGWKPKCTFYFHPTQKSDILPYRSSLADWYWTEYVLNQEHNHAPLCRSNSDESRDRFWLLPLSVKRWYKKYKRWAHKATTDASEKSKRYD